MYFGSGNELFFIPPHLNLNPKFVSYVSLNLDILSITKGILSCQFFDNNSKNNDIFNLFFFYQIIYLNHLIVKISNIGNLCL